MPKIKVTFPEDYKRTNRHDKSIIAHRTTLITAQQIKLPQEMIIQFKNMPIQQLGETPVLPGRNNRVMLSTQLSMRDLVYPLIHELIHLNQIHTHRLVVSKRGTYFWDSKPYHVELDKISYQDYMNLPWERDAYERQTSLLRKVI